MLALYGHPLSSYTWKVLIALYDNEIPFEFRMVDADHPENAAVVAQAGPWGKFPVLADGDNLILESTTIIEYLSQRFGAGMLVPADPDAATGMRMLDRVFDNYVMAPVQAAVVEHFRPAPDAARIDEARKRLRQTYAWLEGWLEYYPPLDHVTLVECAAAPALFYADYVSPMDDFPLVARFRDHLLGLGPVARCLDEAEPYLPSFPYFATQG